MILQSIKWHRAHSQWDERKSCVQSEGHSSREQKLDPQHGSSIRPLSPSPNREMLVVELTRQRAVRTVGASLPWWKSPKKQRLFLCLFLSCCQEHPIPTLYTIVFFLWVTPDTALNQMEVPLRSPPKWAAISLLKMWRGNLVLPSSPLPCNLPIPVT